MTSTVGDGSYGIYSRAKRVSLEFYSDSPIKEVVTESFKWSLS